MEKAFELYEVDEAEQSVCVAMDLKFARQIGKLLERAKTEKHNPAIYALGLRLQEPVVVAEGMDVPKLPTVKAA